MPSQAARGRMPTRFSLGFVLSLLAVWLWYDWSGLSSLGEGLAATLLSPTVAGAGISRFAAILVVSAPLLAGSVALRLNRRWRWAWILARCGLVLVVFDIMNRVRFVSQMASPQFVAMAVFLSAGVALMWRPALPGSRSAQ